MQAALLFLLFSFLIILGILISMLYVVRQQSVAIVERFGRYQKIATSGIHMRLPFGIDKIAARVQLRVLQSEIVVETKTQDNVFVTMNVATQYRVNESNVKDAYYKLMRPESQIKSYIEDALRSSVPKLTLDELFEKKDEIALEVQKTVAEEMQTYGYIKKDLDGDGNISYTQKIMDVNSDGILDKTAWVDKNDGVLIWDKYQDGKVHDSSQYEFTQYGGNTDLEGLAAGFDSNYDGVFDQKDEKFAQFAIWQDLNNDGISQDGEVKTLADWGINSINLISDGITRTDDAGVIEAGRTIATKTDGSEVVIGDAGFEYRNLLQIHSSTISKVLLPVVLLY